MNKWIYFLPQFAMLFPCCSKNPLCPWTGILSRAVSSAWNSASDSSTFQEPRFSRILPWFLDPGIGTTFGYLCSIQLNEIWALVAAFFSAYPQAVQAPAGLLRYFLCEAVERICGHRRCGKNQNLQSLFRKENHLLLGRTEQALCCVPCSMELPPLLRLALPWNKYSGSRKVGFLY